MKILLTIFLLIVLLLPLHSYQDNTHKNLPEDAFLFMEMQGTNQQRWTADYVKAKAQGRYTGACVNINYAGDLMQSDNVQCGALGTMRVGGVKPDYFQDFFWDVELIGLSWRPTNLGFLPFDIGSISTGQNWSSWGHFVNLLERNDGGNRVVTNNYNLIDGYAPNALYSSLDIIGFDFLLAKVLMNNAKAVVDLYGCTEGICSEKTSIATGIDTNPATDYRQNGSRTPVSSGSGSAKLEQQDGTNYNCFADTLLIGACSDLGVDENGSGLLQRPNLIPGGATGIVDVFVGNQDWVIYEPAYNEATFYYNELWLEGFNSRNTSLQREPIVGRYYNIISSELLYFAVVNHWAGDMTQMTHIWATQGYNHSKYEGFHTEHYGSRQIGGITTDNWEDYLEAQAYMNGRQNRYTNAVGNIHSTLIEQAFYTYHIRSRNGYDKMTTDSSNVWKRFGAWAVNNSIAEIALVNEKAILDLRKCRNSSNCDNL